MTAPTPARREEPRLGWLPWAVFLLSVAAFLPALTAEFVKLDDDYNYVNNTNFRGFGPANLRWMFLWFQLGGVYQPLSWVTNAVDYLLWGMNPAGYHLGNLLLHGLVAVLFFFLARRLLSLALPAPKGEPAYPLEAAAALAAAIFAIHPLRVEVVAWASNRSYILPAVFYVLAIAAYLEAKAPSPKGSRFSPTGWLVVSCVCFAVSLMAKAVGMTLPLVLLAIDYFPLRRWGDDKGWFSPAAVKVWEEKVPYFLLALGAAVIAANGRHVFGEFVPLQRFGPSARLAQALFGSVFYLEKTLVPVRLVPLYSMPAHLHPFDALCAPRTVLFILLTGAAIAWRRRWPAGLALWGAYIAAVLPFLGLSQYGRMLQIASDKWCYLASFGWALLPAAALLEAWRRAQAGKLDNRAVRNARTAAGAALALLFVLSWLQTRTWHDTETLFRHILKSEPECYFCHGNLNTLYNERRDFSRAIEEGLASLKVKPDYFLAHVGLSVSYSSTGRLDEAIEHCRIGLSQDPGNPDAAEAHYNLGFFYHLKGDLDKAIEETEIATQLKPYLLNAQFNLAYFLQTKGRLDESEARYRTVLRMNSTHDNAHFNLGILLKAKGRLEESAAECREAHRLSAAHDSPLCPRVAGVEK
ncbi:MAG: tetratricopeptide repeat protein [Elusimicrobia bacterium]|nr:tetratricopeptide repeat protein [Elusimicrobiota bacterium]